MDAVFPAASELVMVYAGAVGAGAFAGARVLSLIGSAVWAFTLVGVGWGIGSGYRHFDSSLDLATVAIVVVLVRAVAVGVRAQRGRATEPAE